MSLDQETPNKSDGRIQTSRPPAARDTGLDADNALDNAVDVSAAAFAEGFHFGKSSDDSSRPKDNPPVDPPGGKVGRAAQHKSGFAGALRKGKGDEVVD